VDFSEDLRVIKKHNDNLLLRSKYLEKKNDPNEQNKKSYQIFAEAIQEILSTYK